MSEDVVFSELPSGRAKVELKCELDPSRFLEPGWTRTQSGALPTFTTARPMAKPGYKPAGLHSLNSTERQAWEADWHRYPPYQYKWGHLLQNKFGQTRLPSCTEKEVILGFPKGYTRQCLPKAQQDTQQHRDCRATLLGNSWNVSIVAWLLSQLGSVLGLNEVMSPDQVVTRTSPGPNHTFQGFLSRPLMTARRPKVCRVNEKLLVRKLLTMVSVKGEDLLLQPSSEDLVRYQRMRTAVPSKLWKWRTIAGWRWTGTPEHINVLELRAAFTAVKWRIEKQQCLKTKFVRLLDSMVCLHALSRGRSSSRKMKRTHMRLNALLLATQTQVVWAYVHTKDNPADAPSRRPRKRAWVNA